ncbi:MAG: hydrogenase formation protein HypD [Candidatus Zixiibacteriota bacterium]
MKYIDEYRNSRATAKLAAEIRRITTREWTIMEICGGQTHSIVKYGIDQLLPSEIALVHGPGCPVCVTPIETVDAACYLAALPEVILCSFGDMLRVPGSRTDLLRLKATGCDIRIVYSPLDAVSIARENPEKQIVFFAVGFETTAPANAMAVFQAAHSGVSNYSQLVSQATVPAAMAAILGSPDNQVQGILAAGHVCAVTGYRDYEPLAAKFGVPIVVTGFEPMDLLHGILMCVRQLEAGSCFVENQYLRSVSRDGNLSALDATQRVYEVCDRNWRGIGIIPGSGLRLREEYASFDAERKFAIEMPTATDSKDCIAGMILRGIRKPIDCPAFGIRCTPESPLGATMVSSEGACAAYYRYRIRAQRTP